MNCEPLVTMRVLRQLFPHKSQGTIWRYNSATGRGPKLPTPDAVNEPGNPVWYLNTVLDWAEETGLIRDLDLHALARLVSEDDWRVLSVRLTTL